MRISELQEHLEALRAEFGDVFIEGNRKLTIGREDFSYIDRDGNTGAAIRAGKVVHAIRICQEDDWTSIARALGTGDLLVVTDEDGPKSV